MDAKAFTANASGRLLRNLEGVITFVPEPLPPNLKLSPQLLRVESKVSNLLGRLEGTAQMLPDPGILIRSFVRREAQLSSYIENTYARYEEVADAEAAPARCPSLNRSKRRIMPSVPSLPDLSNFTDTRYQ